jgi:hypothetical protein
MVCNHGSACQLNELRANYQRNTKTENAVYQLALSPAFKTTRERNKHKPPEM